jgi:two-component system C4-dicarboxylate transport response regulator DctD
MDAPVVVISDDDEAMVRLLERQAATAGLWAVPDLKSEAVQLAALLHPAVVVLDLFQSRYGLDLLREIKADPRNGDVEVVVISGIGADVMRDSCLALGAAEFVSKPLDAAFLVDLARRASQVVVGRVKAQSQRKLAEGRKGEGRRSA